MILVHVQLDTSKVESGDVTGYLRFLNRGNYCTVGGGLVIMMIREEYKRGVGEARTKPGATAKQVERILSLLAIALNIPSESTRSGSCHWHRTHGPASMSSTSRSSQHEILEDYAELFSLFGWQ